MDYSVDIDDDWLFDSVERYANLSMFEVPTAINSFVLNSEFSACYFGEGQINEVLLPFRLKNLSDAERDIRAAGGLHIKAEDATLFSCDKAGSVLLTLRNTPGFSYLNRDESKSDVFQEHRHMSEHICHCICYHDGSITTSLGDGRILVYDLAGNMVKRIFNHSVSCPHIGFIKYTGPNCFAIHQNSTNSLDLVDVRSDISTSILLPEGFSYCDVVNVGDNSVFFATGSDTGHVKVFDTRKTKFPISEKIYNFTISSMKIHDASLVTTAQGRFVYVWNYKLDDGFTHDGHKGVQVDHYYLKNGVFISSSLPGEIHIWEPQVKK